MLMKKQLSKCWSNVDGNVNLRASLRRPGISTKDQRAWTSSWINWGKFTSICIEKGTTCILSTRNVTVRL